MKKRENFHDYQIDELWAIFVTHRFDNCTWQKGYFENLGIINFKLSKKFIVFNIWKTVFRSPFPEKNRNYKR